LAKFKQHLGYYIYFMFQAIPLNLTSIQRSPYLVRVLQVYFNWYG